MKFLSALIIFAIASSVFSQQILKPSDGDKVTCDASKINFRGIKLGDSLESFLKAVRPKEGYAKNIVKDVLIYPTSPQFKDIETITFWKADGRPNYFIFAYKKNGVGTPKDIQAFTKSLSESWGIPTTGWDFMGNPKHGNAFLTCGNVSLFAKVNDGVSLSMRELTLEEQSRKESARRDENLTR